MKLHCLQWHTFYKASCSGCFSSSAAIQQSLCHCSSDCLLLQIYGWLTAVLKTLFNKKPKRLSPLTAPFDKVNPILVSVFSNLRRPSGRTHPATWTNNAFIPRKCLTNEAQWAYIYSMVTNVFSQNWEHEAMWRLFQRRQRGTGKVLFA